MIEQIKFFRGTLCSVCVSENSIRDYFVGNNLKINKADFDSY